MFRVSTVLTAALLTLAPTIRAADATRPSKSGWRKPPAEVMKVLHAPRLPSAWTAPTGEHLLLADPVVYPPLAEMGGPMHVLAGMRVDPTTNNIHGRRVNNDLLRPSGSGYVASHGPDLMRSGDPWFMGVTLAYGPGGEVYVSDWSDTGECHSTRNTRRHTGAELFDAKAFSCWQLNLRIRRLDPTMPRSPPLRRRGRGYGRDRIARPREPPPSRSPRGR